MYFTNMDLFGSFLFGLIIGAILMRLLVRYLAKRNKQNFINSLIKDIPSQIPKNEVILNAIDNNLDQLMQYHGEKVDVISYDPYISCRVDGEIMMLPSSCLTKSGLKTSDADL
jgi:hypothetical protein